MQEKLTPAQIELIQLRHKTKHRYKSILTDWFNAVNASEDGYVSVVTKWLYDGVTSELITDSANLSENIVEMLNELADSELGAESVETEPLWANIDSIEALQHRGSPRTLDMLSVSFKPMPKRYIPKHKLSKIKFNLPSSLDFEYCWNKVVSHYNKNIKIK